MNKKKIKGTEKRNRRKSDNSIRLTLKEKKSSMKNDCIKAKKRGSKKGLKGKEKKSKVQKRKHTKKSSMVQSKRKMKKNTKIQELINKTNVIKHKKKKYDDKKRKQEAILYKTFLIQVREDPQIRAD